MNSSMAARRVSLAAKHFGDGLRYREGVKKGIERLHRQLEQFTRRGNEIAELLKTE